MRLDESTAKAPTLAQDIGADLRSRRGLGVLAVLGLLTWMAFQWGFGNDAVLPTISARVFSALDAPPDWGSGLVAVAGAAVAGGSFWALTQLVDAVVMLTGLHLLPRVTLRLSRWLRSKGMGQTVRPAELADQMVDCLCRRGVSRLPD